MNSIRSGFIILPRDELDRAVLADGPPGRSACWLWLLTHMHWKPGHVATKRGRILVGRGQLAVTDTFLASSWQWERTKVQRFIAALVRWEMIRTDHDQAVRVITICNHERFLGNPPDGQEAGGLSAATGAKRVRQPR